MRLSEPYKQVIAVFLLAVHVFIAIPAGLWHHHPAVKQQVVISKNPKTSFLLKAGTGTSFDNCPVCSHQYAPFTGDIYTCRITPLIPTTARNSYYCLPVVETPVLLSINKG
ncbi:hypothetical protein, partial [Erythrobacter sp. YJ-T3-07]|uniref:hypothetical protein n=1 Tax=Erythrobacter sp. YJ-T3-07 TaxID=2793063 RepID=UPI001F41B6D8